MTYAYDKAFMDYAANASSYAAEKAVALLLPALKPRSVLDVGCAGGAWVAAWQRAGVADVLGVDGDYVTPSQLLIDPARFRAVDLSKPLRLDRTFDLVQCLEVAEHIPGTAADILIDSIASCAERYVVFSAAPPGQGGEYHVNEQSYDYWRAMLARRGFEAFDFVRPALAADPRISFWYRYNVLLYVRREYVASLPSEVAATRIPPDAPVVDVSPRLFQLRKAVVRMLPTKLQYQLAVLKARFAPTGRF